MNEKIEKFGGFLGRKVEKHPRAVAKTLSAVYRGIGLQARRFPNKDLPASREFGQGYTARVLSEMLARPEGTAVVNIFTSCEIFHALDIPVLAPEALALYITNTAIEQPFVQAAQAAGASENLCSFHRCLMGLAETGVLRSPMLVTNTTLACDANQLTFRRLAEVWDVPHFVVEVPYRTDEAAVAYVAEQMRELAVLTERQAGRKLSGEKLREAVAHSVRTQEWFRKYLEIRSAVHLPEAMTPELLNVINSHLYLGSAHGEAYAKMLFEDAMKAPGIGKAPRILWMHILPNAQEPLKVIFQGADNHRVEIVGCDIAFDNLVKMDPDRPYEAMARRIVESNYNGSGARRIERTLDWAKKLKADGVLIFCQWGCKQTQGLAFTAKKAFEEAGLPTLVLDGDACDRTNEASGQAATRASAFVEELWSLKEAAR